MQHYPYAFHVALDGSGLNGLDGRAGVCIFRYDPATGAHAYKVTYYDGVAGGHAPNVDPARRVGFLGNMGQHLLIYDAVTAEEVDRVSTLRFEIPDATIKSSTHVVWLDGSEFLAAIGENFWKFDLNRLTKAEVVAPHLLKIPHAMKRTASGRYVAYGGMDHPTSGEAREVGVLDLVTGTARRIPLPTTCWHLVCHPVLDVFYAISFRVLPGDGRDWQEWGMAYSREYAYEIDAETGQVLRHWSAGREVPAHINSDVCISDSELIFCTGGSQTVVLIDLATMATHRLIEENPGLSGVNRYSRQAAQTVRRQPGPRLGVHQRRSPSQGAAGHRRHTDRRHLRLPALGGPEPALHRQPWAEPPHGLRLPVARAAHPRVDAGAPGVRRPPGLVVRPAPGVPPLLPGQPGARARDTGRPSAVVWE